MKDSIKELLLKFEQKFKKIDLSLERITKFLEQLGSPHLNLPPVIHIAGTNGKGSTIAFLKAMIEADGRSCHVYTSPHLIKFNERIQINGKEITDTQLLSYLKRVDQESENLDLTYFELTTAAAFLAFAENKADFVLLETGLGGRLDATNVVPNTKLCLFTPISHDHMEYLGSQLEQIASEKAGIYKEGAICITAPQKPQVLEILKSRMPEIIVADSKYELPKLSLEGDHQKVNAIAALEVAKTIGLSERAQHKGLTTAKWKARLQRLTKGELTENLPEKYELWLDGAHNDAGAEVISKHIKNSGKNWVLVIGMMKSKDSKAYLRHFIGKIKNIYTIPVENEPNARDAYELATIARSLAFVPNPCANASEAIKKITAIHKDGINILITGSLYLAGRILEKNS